MANSYDGWDYELENWRKYNDRNDVKKPSWFRFEHDFFESETFEGFTAGERLAWLYLICGASKKNGERKPLSYSHALRIGQVGHGDLTAAIEKLVKLQVLNMFDPRAAHPRTVPVPDLHVAGKNVSATGPNGTDGTDLTNGTRAAAPVPLADGVKVALEAYQEVMRYFGVQRATGEREHSEISRAVARHGLEMVTLAFAGARKQKPGKNFDPAQFVAVRTYLAHDKIERYANLGSGKESADGIDWSKICQR